MDLENIILSNVIQVKKESHFISVTGDLKIKIFYPIL